MHLTDVRSVVGQVVQVPVELKGVEDGVPIQAFQLIVQSASTNIQLVDYSFEGSLVEKNGWNTRCILSSNYCDGFSSTPDAFVKSGVLVFLSFKITGPVEREAIQLLDFRLNGGNPSHLPLVPTTTFTTVTRPVGKKDSYDVVLGGKTSISSEKGLLANDNAQGSLIAELVSSPKSGELVLHQDGSFVYVHDDSKQSVRFTYVAIDGLAVSEEIEVILQPK